MIRKVSRGRMRVEIVNAIDGAAWLGGEKGINLPDTDLRLRALTAKDREGMSSRAEVTDAAMASRAECVMLNKGPFIRATLSFLCGVLHRMQSHQTKMTATFRRLGVSRMER